MAARCNFYLDKGSDFNAFVQILGVNQQPVSITNFQFSSQMRLVRKPAVVKDIEIRVDRNNPTIINLFIPFLGTERMPSGQWAFDVEMSYKGIPLERNKRIRVIQGMIIVNDQVTTTY